jgi:hypothetical protein
VRPVGRVRSPLTDRAAPKQCDEGAPRPGSSREPLLAIDSNGYRSAGYNRELYIELGKDRGQWVTELQEPIAPR